MQQHYVWWAQPATSTLPFLSLTWSITFSVWNANSAKHKGTVNTIWNETIYHHYCRSIIHCMHTLQKPLSSVSGDPLQVASDAGNVALRYTLVKVKRRPTPVFKSQCIETRPGKPLKWYLRWDLRLYKPEDRPICRRAITYWVAALPVCNGLKALLAEKPHSEMRHVSLSKS